MGKAIKFRAWDKVDNVMRTVSNISFRTDIIDVEPLDNTLEGYELYDPVLFPGQYELMEYTGLDDTNGVEIYEGDIVKITLMNHETFSGYVKCFSDEGYPAFDLYQVNEAFYFDSNILSTVMNDGSEVEVIGNIYENPQFLKEDK